MPHRETSNYEWILSALLSEKKIGGWVREYRFHKHRRWRSDFCWEAEKLLVEVEGGLRMRKKTANGRSITVTGRHTSEQGFSKDCEKYNEATLLGWRVLRVTPKQVMNGDAIKWIERALGIHPENLEL